MTDVKLNARQEAFAQAVVKNGGDKVAAYKEAGYSTRPKPAVISVKADQVYNNGKVLVRVRQLQEVASVIAKKAFECTIESLAAELEESRVMAIEERQSSAATAATMGKVKLFGFDKVQVETVVTVKKSLDDLYA